MYLVAVQYAIMAYLVLAEGGWQNECSKVDDSMCGFEEHMVKAVMLCRQRFHTPADNTPSPSRKLVH